MSIDTVRNDEAKNALREQLIVTAETYGWHESIGLEFILWEQLTAADTQLPAETIKQIAEKSKAAGGWWIWPYGYHTESRFVPQAEWDTIRANHMLP